MPKGFQMFPKNHKNEAKTATFRASAPGTEKRDSLEPDRAEDRGSGDPGNGLNAQEKRVPRPGASPTKKQKQK